MRGRQEESTQPELAKGKTVGGYAYPFIDKEILEQSFPALKELLVFSYGFTFEGNLVPPLQDDLWMIENRMASRERNRSWFLRRFRKELLIISL